MTNADKYLKDGVDVYKFIDDIFENGETYEAYIDDNNTYAVSINQLRLSRFLLKNVKPTLTKDEKVILRNVSIDFRYIRREQNGELYFCVAENKGCVSNIFANGLFDCIQPRRRI